MQKELENYKGWRITQCKSKEELIYLAYFDISPTSMPVMIHSKTLDKLKEKINSISLYKGNIYYKNYKAKEMNVMMQGE